ncbi:MAG TPA: RteC domain-containing protein [Mucilaginibacter sp.]|nr:RteC domain-containing protein [Mucilaginibacter sp.]
MREFASDLYARMSEALEQLTITSDNILQRAERSYRIVESTLKQLKEYIVHYNFKGKQEEIDFFKEVKPMFLKELIYFMEVFQVESWKPPVGREDEITHYMIGAKRVDLYFKRYNELYTYYRKGSALHDELYFLRRGCTADLITPISISDMDPNFSTVHSFQFAKMQAYEQFSSYLQNCIYRLEHPEAHTNHTNERKFTNLWTDTKAALIELAYAIHSRGAVNNGKTDVKHIIQDLELIFNVQLGNYYRTFQSMRIRKKGRTPFLDTLKISLEKRMDDTDLEMR